MSSLIRALTRRGFTTDYSPAGVVATNPDASVDVYIAPVGVDENANVQIFVDGRKVVTFYRRPDHTILTLVDHFVDEAANRKDTS